MKKIVAALASVSLLAAPLALRPTPAMAQHSHGGSGGRGFSGFSHGGSFRGGFRGGNHGGFGYRGGYGYRGYGPFYAGVFGLALRAGVARFLFFHHPALFSPPWR